MPVLTLYFGGSGHGLEKAGDDAIVDCFNDNKAHGPSAFFPGPGAPDDGIYVSSHYEGQLLQNKAIPGIPRAQVNVGSNKTSDKSYKGAASHGKGWNRNVWYAVHIIRDFIASKKGNWTINCAGHSRGSITIMMLLNDMFYQHFPKKFHKEYTMQKPDRKKDTYKGKQGGSVGKQDFEAFYESRLRDIWANRMGSVQSANYGILLLNEIKQKQDRISGINCWLFDPVAGPAQGGTHRKQCFPNHPLIKRVRVMRMEEGGAFGALSTKLGEFPSNVWSFLSGEKNRSMRVFTARERLVLPLPGHHGSAVGEVWGMGPNTPDQHFIGSNYLVGFLSQCGTKFSAGFQKKWSGTDRLLAAYQRLFAEYDKKPGGKGLGDNRAKIHQHHHKKTGYVSGFVNSDHNCLATQFAQSVNNIPTRARRGG